MKKMISSVISEKLILLFFISCISWISSAQTYQRDNNKSGTGYVLKPEPVSTGNYIIGAFMCPLWSKDNSITSWDPVKKYPEREPVLGWYNEGNPEVTDWEIKYALDHGISFFNVCWYRKKGNAGKPVEELFGHWTSSLLKSRYANEFRFCLLYIDEGKIMDGIASEKDFLENIVPYWINNFFKRPNYLKIDGKPVLTIYRPENFIRNLGGEQQAAMAIRKLRDACIKAGFAGVIIGGEYHGALNKKEPMYRTLDMDIALSYHWPSFTEHMVLPAPSDTSIIRLQTLCWPALNNITDLPSITTVSVGWDSRPWGSTYYKGAWKLSPNHFRQLLQEAKEFLDKQPAGSLSSKILMLDNWNEFGEGHYIFPTKTDGFAYLDAIREVFATSSGPHNDIIPANVGLGPYENE